MTECIICRHNSIHSYSSQTWNFWGTEYTLICCDGCGSIVTSPLPTDKTLEKVYSEGFDYRWYQDHYAAKYRDCQIRISEYQPWMGRRVLDFGGGVGYMSAALRNAGYESITYDPFCCQGDTAEGGWDTLIALHVLEHANDPDRTVAQMKSLLTSRGRLIIAVPNAGGKGYRELGMQWVWAQPPLLHILHFTVEGLKSLLLRHGFIIEETRFTERWDANLYADFEKVESFRYLDSLWSRKNLNRYGVYRKACSALVSGLRFRSLKKAERTAVPNNADLSELQIIARLADAS